MKQINRNFPWCDENDDESFTGILHEKHLWSDEEYFKLDKELYQLADKYAHSDVIPRELAWRIMRIFSIVMLKLGCHSDPIDGYEIDNLDYEQFFERRERFQLVSEGFFSGDMPKTKWFGYGRSDRESMVTGQLL